MFKKIIMLFSIFLLWSSSIVFAQSEEKQKPVVSVNGTIIYVDDVEKELNYFYQQSLNSRQQFDTTKVNEYRKKIIEQLISRELIYQEAVKQGYKPDLNATEEYINALKSSYGSEKAFIDALKEQNWSLDKLKSLNNKYDVINQFVEKELRNRINIEPGAAEKYYNENNKEFKNPERVRASHILIKVSKDASEQEIKKAHDKIMRIRKQIIEGENFEEMAKKFSEGPSSENGGNLGTFTKGQMVPAFEDVAFSINVGEISKPVKTQFGYHLILVKEKYPEEVIPFAEVEQEITEHLTNLALDKVSKNYVADLMKEAKVEFF